MNVSPVALFRINGVPHIEALVVIDGRLQLVTTLPYGVR